jgi:hypothetical protein
LVGKKAVLMDNLMAALMEHVKAEKKVAYSVDYSELQWVV